MFGLTDSPARPRPHSPLALDALQDKLHRNRAIEGPVILRPAQPHPPLCVAAQLYNSLPQSERLAKVLKKHLRAEKLK